MVLRLTPTRGWDHIPFDSQITKTTLINRINDLFYYSIVLWNTHTSAVVCVVSSLWCVVTKPTRKSIRMKKKESPHI